MTDANIFFKRPQKWEEWMKLYRKVEPEILNPPELENSPLKNARKEIQSGLETYTGQWEEGEVRHLLSRVLFGVKKSEFDYFKTLNMEQAVDLLLSNSVIPKPPVNNYEGLENSDEDPHVGLGETWIYAPHGGDKEGQRIVSLKTWLIDNSISQEATIHEKMVLFWSNLLVTKVWDVFVAKASYQYFNMLYTHALGNYKTLIKALTLDPSMLSFLNGKSNTKEAPDENYGRELQELFCIGKGAGSAYTESDVQEAARVLTGWRIHWEPYNEEGTFTSYFDFFKHDAGDKQFSSFYNNRVIEGKQQSAGAEELDDLLDMIFENPECSKYICRRIYSFFVYNEIDENIEQTIIEPLAEIFRENNFEILPVLKVLFKSQHFYDELNWGALIKSPADHVFGLWRSLSVPVPGDGEIGLTHQMERSMLWHMSGMGMEIGDPPNVAGWTPYYQAPQYDKAWITTSTITRRATTTDSLVYWGFWVSSENRIKLDLIAFVSSLDHPEDPNLLLAETTLLLFGVSVSEETINDLKSILLSGSLSDYYWTDAWDDYLSDPNDETKKGIVENRLKWTFQRILQLGEYHLM